MEQITFYCKTISPLFLGNASTFKAELRPSAIKASMRFWWRAVHPNLSVEELRKKECEIFGGSYIKMEDNKKTTENCPPIFRFLDLDQPSTQRLKIDEREDRKRPAIPPKQEFNITYRCKNENIPKLKALMHLASALGGLGLRARRGAGAWEILKYEIDDEADDSRTLDELIYTLDGIFDSIEQLNPGEYRKNSIIELISTSYGFLGGFPYLKEVEIGVKYDTQETARYKIMDTASGCKNSNATLFSDFMGDEKNRLASPIYVSLIRSAEGVLPIISTLNHEYSGGEDNGTTLQKKFKAAILNNKPLEN